MTYMIPLILLYCSPECLQVAEAALILSRVPRNQQPRERDDRDDTYDYHDQHDFDQRKTFLVFP